jgi:hypothetical protein
MKENEFYTVKEIMKQTGYKRTKCYDLIYKLNEQLKEKYPGIVTYSGRILKKFWDGQFKTVKEEN